METVMMDWLARLLSLPEEFLSETKVGGGVIQVHRFFLFHPTQRTPVFVK
jgi:hypothetical protein